MKKQSLFNPVVPQQLFRPLLLKKHQKRTWYLDSEASRHLCNDRSLFSNLRPMSIDFVKAGKKIICSEEMGTVSIPLADVRSIKLLDTALVPEYDSNLISLGQLRETGITFHDNPSHLTLMRRRVVIAKAKWHRNLFILDRAIPRDSDESEKPRYGNRKR